MIPTTGKYRDVVQYIKNNIVNAGNNISPNYIDNKVKNVIDYFSNLQPESYKGIKWNKLWQFRWLNSFLAWKPIWSF